MDEKIITLKLSQDQRNLLLKYQTEFADPELVRLCSLALKKDDTYEIHLPNFGDKGTEIWGIDMKSSQIWPKNAGALLSAIALFCHDRNDQRLDCQLWFAQLDALMPETEE